MELGVELCSLDAVLIKYRDLKRELCSLDAVLIKYRDLKRENNPFNNSQPESLQLYSARQSGHSL